MPENNKTELFLKSLAAVSRMNFQIWDSKGSLRFTTRGQGFDDSAKSGCLKCAKEIILSGAFVYAPHGGNRYVCGLPMPLGNGTTGALLTLGLLSETDDDSAHPRQMEIFLKQIAMREVQATVDIPQAVQQVNEHPNPRFEDLYLFANITKQFRSLRIKQPVLAKLMHQILSDMQADAAFLLLPEHPQYNQMEFHENRFAQSRKTNHLRKQMYKFASRATRRISDQYCIINDSRDNREFTALSRRPYRFMATGVRHLKKSYGWLGLVSYGMDDQFTTRELDILQTLANQLAAMIANMDHHEDLERFTVNMVCSLVCAIEEKDAYAKGHSKRVHQYAMLIARHIGMSPEELETLKWASLLHDIGKIGIPEHVLNKPAKLTADEYELIKKHPMKGKTILEPIRHLSPSLTAVAHHHERYNGTGYPKGLKGEQIPLAARIIAVADTFDAITSSRSYRKPISPREAMLVLDQVSGTQLDARLVNIFKTVYRQQSRRPAKLKKVVNA
jgi:HD-GYP domain-containing protein (c-di-GMP phosphodiesterase class II)